MTELCTGATVSCPSDQHLADGLLCAGGSGTCLAGACKVLPDAGPADAGSDALDAGADGLDASADGLDAGADGLDAGVDGLDAGADGLDAAPDGLEAGADAGDASAGDGHLDLGGDANHEPRDGCDCQVSRPTDGLLWMLGLVLVLARRRKWRSR